MAMKSTKATRSPAFDLVQQEPAARKIGDTPLNSKNQLGGFRGYKGAGDQRGANATGRSPVRQEGGKKKRRTGPKARQSGGKAGTKGVSAGRALANVIARS